ncbi:hypothetical protein CVT25_005337 [Psilocybe cyanescens]|uniref:Uncharacterized protein n=1 Tax=Psilocybe cyanescens TaxID=93625 RepID=A0A409WWT3_PSICY|nr:hypothetical protein CVT25_005337 [Psilocybe cyanescens]
MLSTSPKSPLQPTNFPPWKDWHGPIRAIAFFPDGKRIVTAGHRDNTTRVWDLESGEEDGEPFLGHDHISLAVAVSKSGSEVVTGGADNKVFLWKENDRINPKVLFAGPTTQGLGIFSVAFSSTTYPMLVASCGSDGVVNIWEVKPDAYSEARTKIREPGYIITSIQFSPSNPSLIALTSTYDKKIRIYNTFTGEQIVEMAGHTTHVSSFAWFPGGHRLASSGEKSVRIWDSRTGKETGVPFLGHERLVKTITISPDGKYIASGSNDGTVRVWSVATRGQLGTQIAVAGVSIVRFSPDGQSLLTVSERNGVQLWPMAHLEVEEGLKFTREVVDDLMASSEAFRIEMRNTLQEKATTELASVKDLIEESANASYSRINDLQDYLNSAEAEEKEQFNALSAELKRVTANQDSELQAMKGGLAKLSKKNDANFTGLKEAQDGYSAKQDAKYREIQDDLSSMKKDIGSIQNDVRNIQKLLVELNANFKKPAGSPFSLGKS